MIFIALSNWVEPQWRTLMHMTFTGWKVSKYGVFSGAYFPAFGLNMDRFTRHVSRKQSTTNFPKKTNIPYPLIRTCTCAYHGVRNVYFSENLAYFVFLGHPFCISPYSYRMRENTDQKKLCIWTLFTQC